MRITGVVIRYKDPEGVEREVGPLNSGFWGQNERLGSANDWLDQPLPCWAYVPLNAPMTVEAAIVVGEMLLKELE